MFSKSFLSSLAIITLPIFSFGQTPSEPSFTLPTPEVAKMMRYGDLPIGKFTGTFTYDYPVYTIKSGTLSHNISLGYSTNGVKVDEVAGRAGLNWILKMGGEITRNVLDKPDETSSRHYWTVNQGAGCNGECAFWSYVRDHDLVAGADSQPDEYSFKFGDFSGKFLFDRQGKIQQFRYNGLEITGSPQSGFTITTTNGDKYCFTVFEMSKPYSDPPREITPSDVPTFSVNTWHLKKIISQGGDIIDFDYDFVSGSYAYPITTYLNGISQNVTTNYTIDGSSYFMYLDRGSSWQGNACTYNEGGTYSLDNSIMKSDIAALTVSGIRFKNGRLQIKYSNRLDALGEKKIDTIQVFADSGPTETLLKTVVLNHSYSNASSTYDCYFSLRNIQFSYPELRKRLILDSICELSSESEENRQVTAFSYDDVNSLPSRFSFSQDKYGYFNGQHNSYFFFPNDTYIDALNGRKGIGANRRYNFNFCKKGVMTKIVYPTGGYSTMSYEPNREYNNGFYDINIDRTATHEFSPTAFQHLASSSSVAFPLSDIQNRLIVYCNWDGIPQDQLTDSYYGTVSLVDAVTGDCIAYCDRPVTPGDSLSISLNPALGFSGGRLVKIKLLATRAGIVLNAVLERHFEFLNTNPDLNGVGGVRIKEIQHYDQLYNKRQVKKFLYAKWDSLHGSSGKLDPATGYDFVTMGFKGVRSNQFTHPTFCGYNIIRSNPIKNLYISDNSTVVYPTVIELNENETTNSGGIEYNFDVSLHLNVPARPLGYATPSNCNDYSPIYIPGATASNYDFTTGNLLSTHQFTYSTVGGARNFLVSTLNEYSIDSNTMRLDSFLHIVKLFDHAPIFGGLPPPQDDNGLYCACTASYNVMFSRNINKYYRIFGWQRLLKTTTTEYIYSGANLVNQIVNEQHFKYSPNNYRVSELATLSSSGRWRKLKTKFPLDFNYTNSPIGGNGIIELQGRNMIDLPIVEEHINEDGETISKVVYNYQLVPTPHQAQSVQLLGTTTYAKGLFQKTNFTIDAFDKRGNVSQITSGNGVITSYVWGYNGQYPVAKVIGVPITSLLQQSGVDTALINNPASDIQLRTELAKLRTVNAALVTTFTYKPLIGLATETDVNGKTISFEYDGFNRLKLIRDENGKIRKAVDYQINVPLNQ